MSVDTTLVPGSNGVSLIVTKQRRSKCKERFLDVFRGRETMGTRHGKQTQADLAPAGRATDRAQGSQMGDAPAMQTFYQENFALMYRFIYSKIGNREEAEDITSDIFLKAVLVLD